MIFVSRKLIFIHQPKTAGNFIGLSLLKYADDAQTLAPFQDGLNQYELSGRYTQTKHQPLADYVAALGGDLTGWTVFAVARPPLDRLASLYYSPHWWLREGVDRADLGRAAAAATFDPARFARLVQGQRSLHQMLDHAHLDTPLSLNGAARHASGASIRLIEFAHLRAGLAGITADFAMPDPDYPAEPVNTSAAAAARDAIITRNAAAQALVADSKHRHDAALFT